jgi:predicted transcriptional regulator
MNEESQKKILEYAERKQISSLPVHEFMSKGILKVVQGSSIRAVIAMFKEHKISGAPVVDLNDRMVGIVTGYDLLLQAATRDLNDAILYNKKVLTLKVDDSLKDAIKALHKTKYHRLPVINGLGSVLGVVSQQDILNELVKYEGVVATGNQ